MQRDPEHAAFSVRREAREFDRFFRECGPVDRRLGVELSDGGPTDSARTFGDERVPVRGERDIPRNVEVFHDDVRLEGRLERRSLHLPLVAVRIAVRVAIVGRRLVRRLVAETPGQPEAAGADDRQQRPTRGSFFHAQPFLPRAVSMSDVGKNHTHQYSINRYIEWQAIPPISPWLLSVPLRAYARSSSA